MPSKVHPANQDMDTIATCWREQGVRVEKGPMQGSWRFARASGHVSVRRGGEGLACARTAPLASRAGPCHELPESGDGEGLALGKRVGNGGGWCAERCGDVGL